MNFSHPLAEQQIEAVEKVLSELDVSSIPKLMVWNKVKRGVFLLNTIANKYSQTIEFCLFSLCM